MKLRLWGTRGSIPAPGPSTVRYGGNTSCAEVRLADDTLIILDAGSGIRPLGASLGQCEATLLLSHYHWDHIQGFPFFGPAYSPESRVHVFGPESNGEGPEDYLAGQMMTPYFPAAPSQLVGVERFEVTHPHPFAVGSAVIHSGRVCHPGITVGYRIEADGQTLVYISDNEVDLASTALRASMIELAAGADVLIHDCQYNEGEYAIRHGWGHSTPRQAVSLACQAGVRRLILFHHDPSHSDEQVEALAEEARRLGSMEILIGREGETVAVGAPSLPSGPAHRPLTESSVPQQPSV
jgi:phosphoribosyl 1,2-cyclic phosphodiesterase